ncbi:MAG: cell wall metabolism sensor histidine kinase WalK, partial [Chloroflexi bacterium]|nr:cell wall metabolism sensor histidine kinase WalK [Chloroflexota bacterium]
MFTSIRWRITGVYVLLTLASIVLLSVLFLQFAKSFYADNLRSQLSAQAHLVADDLSAYSFEPAAQGASLDAVAKQIGRQLGTRITIIDKSGVVLGDSMENPAAMENHATRPEVAAALKGDLGNSQRHSTTTGEDMLYVAVPVVSKGSIIGVARASIPLTAMDAPLSDFGRTILLVAAGTIAAAALVSFQMARLTTRPLKQLTVMARSIAGGHLNQRVHVSLRDEVAELAEAFNEMAARLGETLQAISTEKSKLEVILANMADAVLLTDQGGRVTLVNPAGEQLLGIKRTEVLGRSLIEAVRDHEVAEIVESCLLQKEPRSGMVEDARARRLLRVVATPVGG